VSGASRPQHLAIDAGMLGALSLPPLGVIDCRAAGPNAALVPAGRQRGWAGGSGYQWTFAAQANANSAVQAIANT